MNFKTYSYLDGKHSALSPSSYIWMRKNEDEFIQTYKNMKAKEKGVPIISSMGAGNKLDPTMFRVADIYKTKVCPLAKVMRRELKKRGVKKLKVVYSEEQPTRPINDMAISCRNHCICPPGAAHKCTERRDIPGSTAFVPSVVGLIIAGEVIKDLTKDVIVKAEE